MIHGFALQFAQGLAITIRLAVAALGLGLFLGVLGALGKLSPYRFIYRLTVLTTSLIRGLPEILVIFFIYFGGTVVLSNLFGNYIEISSFTAGVTALGLIFGAYASETFRGAYLAIHQGQLEAAKAFGLSPWQAFSRIMLPQLWRHALPGLGNLWFVLLKDTALVSLIGLADLMQVAQNITAYTGQPFNYFLIAAVIYLCLTSVSMLIQKKIDKRVSRHMIGGH